MATYWCSPAPTKCDTCHLPLANLFYDEKTEGGSWGCICHTCHTLGPGLGRLGLGWGQKYEMQPDGKWLKTEG